MSGDLSAARWQTYHRQMDRLRERRDKLAVRRLDLVLAVTALLLLAATAALLADKSLSFALVDRSADVAINALTVLAAASLAALALARYREAGRLAGLYQASAFLLIAWISLLNVAVVVLKVEDEFGLSLGAPGQLPLYVFSISRLVTVTLLVMGGAAAVNMLHGQPRTRRALLRAEHRVHGRDRCPVPDPRSDTSVRHTAAALRRARGHQGDDHRAAALPARCPT